MKRPTPPRNARRRRSPETASKCTTWVDTLPRSLSLPTVVSQTGTLFSDGKKFDSRLVSLIWLVRGLHSVVAIVMIVNNPFRSSVSSIIPRRRLTNDLLHSRCWSGDQRMGRGHQRDVRQRETRPHHTFKDGLWFVPLLQLAAFWILLIYQALAVRARQFHHTLLLCST